MRILVVSAVMMVAVLFTGISVVQGQQPSGLYRGWEPGSAYESLYNPKKVVSIKGTWRGHSRIVPFHGMAPGTQANILARNGTMIHAQLGPEEYVRSSLGYFSSGDDVKVIGCWATIAGKRVLMAQKLRLRDLKEIKFRMTSDGRAVWNYNSLHKSFK